MSHNWQLVHTSTRKVTTNKLKPAIVFGSDFILNEMGTGQHVGAIVIKTASSKGLIRQLSDKDLDDGDNMKKLAFNHGLTLATKAPILNPTVFLPKL